MCSQNTSKHIKVGQHVQVSLAAYPLLLLGVLGTSIAPLCGLSTGWAYYHTDHLHTISASRPESAWVRRAP